MSDAPYPPAEPPADGDRTNQVPPPGAPRYSASASVPVPPANAAPGNPYGNPAPFGQPGAYGAGAAPFGQPPTGQPGPAQPGQPGQPGQARVGGSASVPSFGPPPTPAPPSGNTYGSGPQGYQPQASVYGQPSGQPGGQGGGQPGGQQYGQPQPQQYGQPAPGGFGPPPAGTYGSPQGATYGQPQGQQYGQPQPQPQQYGQPQPYGAPGQEQGRAPQPQQQQQQQQRGGVPTGGWPYVEQSEQPARTSRKGLTIALIVVALVVVVGIGGYVGLKLATQGNDAYAVGACVKQSGTNATVVDCSQAGAYRITSIVDTENGCPDPSQPSLVLSTGGSRKYACLSPAS